jgi:shikimate kinase
MNPTAAAPIRHLALVGMMGSGKTSVGRLASRGLGRPFVDLDQSIEVAAQMPIPEIFTAHGERGFREIETQELLAELDRAEPVVIATGGGVVLSDRNRRALSKAARVIWLRARPETLVSRVRGGRGRPLLADGEVDGRIDALVAARRPCYQEAADCIIDVDDLSLDETTAAVMSAAGEVVS